MIGISVLLPIALLLGLAALVAFLWTVRNGQYEDMDGAARRILLDDEPVDNRANERANERPGTRDDR